MSRKRRTFSFCFILNLILVGWPWASASAIQVSAAPEPIAKVDPARSWGIWEGWGSSLAWWARAIGGTSNADLYADLIYTTKAVSLGGNSYPGLGLNVARYNVGGGGIGQPSETKSPKMPWFKDIHGYWTALSSSNPGAGWNWDLDQNQRAMMLKARERGANLFELFSDSPMWWMNTNSTTAGGKGESNCLDPVHYGHFAQYLAAVASHARTQWHIDFQSVEAFNEPAAKWWKFPGTQEGCNFDTTAQRAVLPKLRAELDKEGLKDVLVAASDENSADDALKTWNDFDQQTRSLVGRVNVHGYFSGTNPYRGPNLPVLRNAVTSSRRLWMSEYGDNDGSGLTMAESIVKQIRGLHPTAWVYWQPVEPESGWGMINAAYVDTGDRASNETPTPVIRVNRKFFVFGQFTRYLRPGAEIIDIDDENSIAAYEPKAHRVIIITENGNAPRQVKFDLSRFSRVGPTFTRISTTTSPGNSVPDLKLKTDSGQIGSGKRFSSSFFPNTVQTFLVDGVYR